MQLSSRGRVDIVPEPILPEKFLGYSRESDPGPFGSIMPNHYAKQAVKLMK